MATEYKGFIEPALMDLGFKPQNSDGRVQPRFAERRKGAGLLADQFFGQVQRAGMLLGGGFGMHLRHPRQVEIGAHLGPAGHG